jgi:hypothetical protein
MQLLLATSFLNKPYMTICYYETKFGSTITSDPCNPIHKIHLIIANQQGVNWGSGISEGIVLSEKVRK